MVSGKIIQKVYIMPFLEAGGGQDKIHDLLPFFTQNAKNKIREIHNLICDKNLVFIFRISTEQHCKVLCNSKHYVQPCINIVLNWSLC